MRLSHRGIHPAEDVIRNKSSELLLLGAFLLNNAVHIKPLSRIVWLSGFTCIFTYIFLFLYCKNSLYVI